MSGITVHPVADLFPMLADDELAELAEDIKQRGLLHPIVLDTEGRVLDGRNRLAACELAGVGPEFVTYDGDDPDGYALAVNIARRHLTKGQQAMVAARALLVSNTTQQSAANSLGVNRTRVAQAVTVRDHAPDMVDAVIAGATGLDEAYRVARERKTAADSVEAQLAKLRAEDPELAAKVVEGELTLTGAWAERKERAAVERAHAVRVSDSFRTVIGRILVLYKTQELRAEVARIYGAELGDAMPAQVDADTIREAGDYLHQIADEWKERQP
jgi:ParB/RepB/Spo0J family partition protein